MFCVHFGVCIFLALTVIEHPCCCQKKKKIMLKKTYRLRVLFLVFLSFVLFGIIEARLYYLQVHTYRQFANSARRQQTKTIHLTPRRGDILDRNGNPLATSFVSDTIILDLKKYYEPEMKLAHELARAFTVSKNGGELKGRNEEALAQKKAEFLEMFNKPDHYVLAGNPNDDAIKLLDRIRRNFDFSKDVFSVNRTEVVLDTRKYREQEPAMIKELSAAVGRGEFEIAEYFKSDKMRRHILCRKASDEISRAVTLIEDKYQLPHDAIIYEKNSKRNYPQKELASHILGYTKIDDSGDNIGQSGIELKYDKLLKGQYAKTQVPVMGDLNRNKLAPVSDEVIESTFGNNLVLTIDQRIQAATERALRKRVGEVQAKGGIAVVMDVPTGEILALASCPDFDPNDFSKVTKEQRKNRMLSDPIEIGSVMKILTATLLVDKGLVQPDEMVDCKGGYLVLDGRRLVDAHKLGVVPFREAFADSSNIALCTLGKRLEPAVYYEGLTNFGLGQRTGVDLPGEEKGIFYPLERWTLLSRTSLPMGYECALTGMQVVSALGAVGNGGVRMRPHLLKEVRTPKGQVIQKVAPEAMGMVASRETCQTMMDLMEGVVVSGTGVDAQIPGYRIGGKTGTSRKSNSDAKKYISSFAGLMPIQQPQLAFYIYIDEPSGSLFYGGKVSGPVFKEIALQVAHILGIPPDDPVAFEQAKQQLLAPMTASGDTTATMEAELAANLEMANDTGTAGDLTEGESVASAEVLPENAHGVRMPDCMGMTMVEAWDALHKANVQARMKGSGVVARQEPPAGMMLPEGKEATIIFAHPSEIKRTAINDAASTAPAHSPPPAPAKPAAPPTAKSKTRSQKKT